MKLNKKICISCNNECFIYSKKRCKNCAVKEDFKPLKKITEKSTIKKTVKKENTLKLHNWFQELWESEPHYSEISGEWLGNENSSIYWHHLYPKNKYPQYEFDRDNIVRLTASEHQECEFNPTKYKYVVDKLELLKKKYEILY